MTQPDCPRLFEAEAHRDGRLTGVERTSFERHLATCAACAREVDALEALAAPLRDGAAAPSTDELHARRERLRLLSAFERSRLGPEPRHGAIRRLLPALAASLVVVLGVVFVLSRRDVNTPAGPATASAVIHAQGPATWSRHVDEHTERVVLSEGTLRIQREHRAGSPRLVVVLPDGELEDIGTTFYVSVKDGRTTHVGVEEGRVVLRLRGKAPVTLDRGSTFAADTPVAAAGTRSPSLGPSASQGSSENSGNVPSPRAKAGTPASARSAAPSATPDDDAARDFRAATAALDAGDNGRAAAGFARFLAQHGRDPRAEDAAYLRVIALQRSGGVDATRRAASEYLRRYPQGFRRAEVEALLGD